ncbi:DUF2891 family protein [Helcobacillus massiliensis]|uniref:DUF2891 family protein n=1 Tax=Helcobacillus massiliensis TaxID=521392 RepID=A0A839R188_9MICO|nr:DUF2891 family protein [Helcobacillus massiliensis]MBB3022236.1 hypothetical protein [Helcobacillus massiliensis]
MDTDLIDAFAAVALDNITRHYPYAAHHVQADPADMHTPAALHPAFGNSFDWHSSVHMHWLLTQLIEEPVGPSPAPAWRQRALDLLQQHLSAENIQTEVDYLRAHPTWERPYGWAWAAMLADSLATATTPELQDRAPGAAPLADTVLDLTITWLSRTDLPVRHGLHTNTAFALRRLLMVAERRGRTDAADAIRESARRFFTRDRAWAFHQERSGHDFLSPGLCEADLMLLALDPDELAAWLPAFLTDLGEDSEILRPVPVLDPTDGHQSHLDGLGLTAAASGLRLARALDRIGARSDLSAALRAAAPSLMAPGTAAAVSDEYMASHWLATFAWEASHEVA